jgi:hypothetical protein
VPLVRNIFKVVLDLEVVEQKVLSSSLDKVCRLLEDLSPLGNLRNIILKVGAAGGHERLDHACKISKVFESMDDVPTFKLTKDLLAHLGEVF